MSIRRPALLCAAVIALTSFCAQAQQAWFGGQPPLGAQDQLRHLFKPYSAVQLDYLGANYCENMLDKRLNTTSFTHQSFDTNNLDAWHLQFPDDAARCAESFVWEDEYSGICRLETVRRLELGMLAAHIPGTQGYHFFRHRSGGKTYLIFDHPSADGRLLLSTWGDEIQGLTIVGFQAQFPTGSTAVPAGWLESKDFTHKDAPDNAASPAVARSPEFWNESPFTFTRTFTRPGQSVVFTGRYGLSDEDKPIEYAYESEKAEKIAIILGEPGKHMPLLWDAQTPGIVDFGDRKTQWRSDKDGNKMSPPPDCRYLVLRKNATWACPGYGSCLLVLWQDQPESIEALAENGYGQLRFVFANKGAGARAKLWLYPFHWISEDDMEYVFRNAESFLAQGRLMHNGFPSQQMVNAIPSGLAAAAYLLTKYNDPLARTAQIEAVNAVDAMLEPEHKGRRFIRLFFEVKAAAWMVRLGKELNDQAMADKYTDWVKLTMDRLLSKEGDYDGKAWGDGWTHFNNMRTVWTAYEATGIEAYREAYERAMDVYTIDAKGVYRYGEPLKAPGGFDVYAGSLPMGAWGHWGLKDRVDQLINLNVPNGWHHPDIPVSDLWNDAGAGPWSQDDAQPEMVGFMLRGYNLPKDPKRLLPTGAFAKFDEQGNFEATWAPITDNPCFLPGPHEIRELKNGEVLPPVQVKTTELDLSGLKESPPCITQSLDISGAGGAALDLRVNSGSYIVEVSPDGQHWIPRLDTWCDKPTTRSVDLSFLTGSTDQLVRTLQFAPPDDAPYLQSATGSEIIRTHCRTVAPGGNVVYRLFLPRMDQCHLEFIVGNNYRIDLSSNGNDWTEALSPAQIPPAKGTNQKNAAWMRLVDATKHVSPQGEVYVRLRNAGNDDAYGNQPAFLRRLAIYGTYKTPTVHLRVKSAPYARQTGLAIDALRLRTW